MAALLIFFLLILVSSAHAAPEDTTPMTDEMALLLLKESFTNSSDLSSWNGSGGSPCDEDHPWTGVICFRGIVTGLRLAGMGLGGTVNVDALAHFRGLRSISLDGNRLSGPMPDFGKLTALKSLYLSGNEFSGTIPDALFARMTHLKKLWLSGNAFSGPVPSSLSAAKSLIELHLEGNHFSGPLPDLNLPSLKSFDISGNDLSGPVPHGLSRFGPDSFRGNSDLCGATFSGKPCGAPPPAPAIDVNAAAAAAASAARDAAAAAAAAAEAAPEEEVGKGRLTVVSLLLAVVAASAILAMAVVLRRKRREREFDALVVEHGEMAEAMESAAETTSKRSSHKRPMSGWALDGSTVQRRNGSSRGGVAGAAELVVVNEEKGSFCLTDLMKAAAEVLGNGGLGSSYKAVMGSGVAVVVKRLRELNKVGRDGFEQEMRRFGTLRHPNVLPPLAYHFRKDEKLIVYEYVPKGSLLYLLHGDRGADHAALDWATRMKMARGIARGMAYLHSELSSSELPHGNLKSSNVLIGADYEPLLVDYGLAALVNPSAAAHALFAHKSPEVLQLRRVSPKSDVYCLGILILELLTGKYPSQYNTKGGTDIVQWAASAMAERREAELLDPDILTADRSAVPHLEQLLRVAAACAEPSPDLRPDMREAAARIEEIAIAAGLADDDATSTAAALVRSLSRAESHGERSCRRNSGDSFFSTSSGL